MAVGLGRGLGLTFSVYSTPCKRVIWIDSHKSHFAVITAERQATKKNDTV